MFNVIRAGDLSSGASVDFFTVPHTAETNPAADFDFTSTAGKLEFAPGEGLKQVTVKEIKERNKGDAKEWHEVKRKPLRGGRITQVLAAAS